MRLQVGFATDIGRKRSQNQDNVAALPELNLYMVADGMGGHRGGETASALAVEITRDMVARTQASVDWTPEAAITEAIKSANRTIYQRAAQQPELQGMGTTMTALLFKDGRLTIGHVGDSRCYFMRPAYPSLGPGSSDDEGASIWQLTRDHSVVQEKLRAGLITREELKTDRMKNVITRSVGFEPEVNVELYCVDIRPGDTFLICSDGLSGMIDDSKMLSVVEENLFAPGGDLDRAVSSLIDAANANGGDDNVTTVMVRVIPDIDPNIDEETIVEGELGEGLSPEQSHGESDEKPDEETTDGRGVDASSSDGDA